jgi:predicted homoserine dehydrogenase-like protein
MGGEAMNLPVRIGISGTGFIARGLMLALELQDHFTISKVLTRRRISECAEFPRPGLLTNSIEELIGCSDLVVECSGSVIGATKVVDAALSAPLPVVTMNTEFHITTGSYFAGKGMVTEAEGDQPGCLAALRENVMMMGFKPLVYGNIKGYLNLNPTKEDMTYWASRGGISLPMVTAFTDGTKIQMEQTLVANGLGAGIAAPGLLGPQCDEASDGGNILAMEARRLGYPISDYILSPKSPAGVFIVAEHDERQHGALAYFKLGKGPTYTLLHNYHLCHLEIIKTIRRVLTGGGVLLDNSAVPSFSTAAIAKKRLEPGHTITQGIGSFDVRGSMIPIADDRAHIPIGLLTDAIIIRTVEPGQTLRFEDIELHDNYAADIWREIINRKSDFSCV